MPVAQNHHHDWKRAVAAPLLLLLVIVLFYWKITLSKQYTWLESPDLAMQVLPWFQFQAVEWHHGHFPLWEAYLWGGQPLVGQTQPGAVYPLNWLLFLLPLHRGFIRISSLHWYFVLIHYMAALFCYWLCRDLGRSRAASLLAGLGFSLGGWMGSTEWPQMLNGALWTPLVFLFQFRAMRGRAPLANAALAGACLGMAFLAGHHQVPIFVALASGGVWIYALVRDRGAWRAVAAFGLLLFLVSAAQTLPAYEYGKLALRWVGVSEPVSWNQPVPYSVHIEYGLRPLSLLGTIVPGIFRHADPYIGLVLLSMALAATLTMGRTEWPVRVLAAIALGGLLYSLAQFGSLEAALYALVPVVEKARNPSMAIFMFHFGVAVLSAYGIDTYTSVATLIRRAAWGFCGILFAALLIAALVTTSRPVDFDKVAMAGFTALLLPLALRSRHMPVLLGGLMVLEAGLSNSSSGWLARHENPNSYLRKMEVNADIAAFLKQQAGPVRISVDNQLVPYNFGDWFGIDHFGGLLASLTRNVYWNMQQDFFAVNFYVGAKPERPDQVLVFTGAGGLNVYRNPGAGPRVWSESACAAGNRVALVSRRPGYAVVDADLRCPSTVVLAETWFPGWQASIDGRPSPVRQVRDVLQAVDAGAGRHRIELRYRPASVIWGGALSILGGLAAAFAAFYSHRAGPMDPRSRAKPSYPGSGISLPLPPVV